MDCFMSKPVIPFVSKVLRNGLLHVQTCDNVPVQSATQWTTSVHTLHVSKPVITFVFKVLRNGLLHVQTCDNVRVQSATQWTALVHTLHMPKPVITFVFKVPLEILHLLSKLFWNFWNDTKKGVSNSYGDQKKPQNIAIRGTKWANWRKMYGHLCPPGQVVSNHHLLQVRSNIMLRS